MPKDEQGRVLAPPRLGHPEGYLDEPNYLKILFAARAFPAVDRLIDRLMEHRKKETLSTVPAE
jgi:hypothetical protein